MSLTFKSSGPVDSKSVFILEVTGEHETSSNGRVVQQFNKTLGTAGIDFNSIRILYAVRTVAANEDRKILENPTTWEEIEACLPAFEQEIKTTNPNVIVPLGNIALSIVLGDKRSVASTKITKVRGTEFLVEKYNIKCMPSFHPAIVLRDPSKESTVVQDFIRIKEASQFKELSKGDEGNYITLDTLEKVDSFFDRMKDVPNFVFDIETNSLDWKIGEILCIAFSWKEKTACVLPVTKYVGVPYQEIEIKKRKSKKKVDGKIQEVEVEKQVAIDKVRDTYQPAWGDKQEYVLGKLKELLESDKGKIGQNLKFDVKWFMQKGWKVNNVVFDTMLAAHLINENNKGGLDLTSLSKQYTSMGAYDHVLEDWFKENKVTSKNRNYARVPEEILYKYAAMDADCTYRLFVKFSELIAKEGLTSIFTRLIIPLSDTLTEAEWRGVKIDTTYLKALKQELETDIAALEKRIKDVTGDVNLNSPDQLRKLLFHDLKLPKIKKTKGKEDSTDVEVLKILADMHPIPQLILDYRKLEKLYTTYVVGIEEVLDANGYLHGSFNICGTESGRLSSSSPNLQNIPKKDKRIKKMFAAEEGNVMVEGDLSMAEIRFWAEFSRDPQLLQDLYNGLDMHREVAARVYKIPPEQVTDDQRTFAKRTAFGLLYGMSDQKFSIQNKCSLEDAAKGRQAFFGRYPIAKQWLFHISKEARMNGYVRNLFGRVRHLPGINSQDEMAKYEAEAASRNCVDEKTEILTLEGWKNYKELQLGNNVATKNPETGALEWQPILKLNIFDHVGEMMEFESNTFSALTTSNHRWLVDSKSHLHGKRHMRLGIFKDSQHLSAHGDDKIHLTADSYSGNLNSPFTNDEVEFIGWLMTDGTYRKPYFRKGRLKIQNCDYLVLFQSLRGNPKKAKKIHALIKRLGIRFSTYVQKRTECKVWSSSDHVFNSKIRNWLPERKLNSKFLLNLSFEQLQILYNTMLLGDGSYDKQQKRHRVFTAKTKEQVDMFSMLCVLIGKPCAIKSRDMSKYHPQSDKLLNIPKMGIVHHVVLKQRNRVQPNWGRKLLKNWKGVVWCPTVENKTWVARRNGIVYITGNSPIQGTASDYACNAANRIVQKFKELGLQGKLRILVHDAIIMDIPKEEFEQSINIMREEMQRPVCNMVVPMVADFSFGSNWGTMEKYKFEKETTVI